MKYVKPETRQILRQWRKEVFNNYKSKYIFAFSLNRGALSVYSDKPGILIGRYGKVINKYIGLIKNSDPDILTVSLVEVESK